MLDESIGRSRLIIAAGRGDPHAGAVSSRSATKKIVVNVTNASRCDAAAPTPARRGAATGRGIARWISTNDAGASNCGSDCTCARVSRQLVQLGGTMLTLLHVRRCRRVHGLAVAQAQQMVDTMRAWR